VLTNSARLGRYELEMKAAAVAHLQLIASLLSASARPGENAGCLRLAQGDDLLDRDDTQLVTEREGLARRFRPSHHAPTLKGRPDSRHLQ
jgi:hypothetical protein